MKSSHRLLLHWSLRLAALAVIVWLLQSKIRWQDEVVRVSGDVERGRVVAVEGGTVTIETQAGTQQLGPEQVEVVRRGTQELPQVSYGLRTLGERVAKRAPWGIAILGGLFVLILVVAWRWALLVRTLGLPMPYGQALRLTLIGGFFNIAVPGATGGDVVKAYYAARVTGAPTRAVLSVFVDRFIGLFGLVALGGTLLWLHPDMAEHEAARIFVAGVIGAVFLFGLVFGVRRVRRGLGLSKLMRKLPFQGVLAEIQEAVRLYKSHGGAILIALGISLLNHAGAAVAVWAIAQSLSIEGVDLATCMALVPVINVLSAIPLLPGGWGVGEAAFAYFFGQVGVPPTEAVGLSVIFRLSLTLVNLPGGWLWLRMRGHTSTERMQESVDEITAGLEPA